MKFKVFDKERGRFLSDTCTEYNKLAEGFSQSSLEFFPILTIQGVEIVVDSDIFEFNHYLHNGEVLRGMFTFNQDELRYEINIFNNEYLVCAYYDPSKISNIKVIGNVQQNPELCPFDEVS